jgi:hypothetical protein
MAEIFNTELTRDDGGARPVIPAELGAGKTTAAKLWCAMLPYAAHPGVLVVVRTIEAAKEFAADVNVWADVPITAYAYHHEVPREERENLDALAWFPVLVICHRAYELSLDPLAVVGSRASFEKVHAFRDGGRRRLVIVDEALDQVHEARISRAGLQRAMSYIPSAITRKHSDAMDTLDSVARALRNAPEDRHAVLTVKELLARVSFTPDEADGRLMAMWDDVRLNRMKPENRLVIGEAISSVRRHLFSYRWTNGEGRQNTAITGGRLLLPPEAALVVLDATGRLNSIYTGRPDYYRVEPMGQVRNYENVTIHHARTRGTGKVAMSARGDEIAQHALDAMPVEGREQRRVLVVTNKDSEGEVAAIWAKGGFAEVAVAHWGAIDGRNDWADFDTLVILTLPYTTPSHDLTTFMAITGRELDEEALNAPPDEVRTMRETRVAAALAQAMGRVRLRRMSDEAGGCEPCEIYLRLPNWRKMVDPENVLASVARTLPGASIVPWAAASTRLARRAPVARQSGATALLAYVRRLPPDTSVPVKNVREAIGATAHGTWFRLQADPEVAKALAKEDTRIVPASGRRPAALVKGSAVDTAVAMAGSAVAVAAALGVDPSTVRRRRRLGRGTATAGRA